MSGSRCRPGERLSSQERLALAHRAAGLTEGQTAHRMCLSDATVHTHMSRVRDKLGADDTAHAVMLACRRGELDLELASRLERGCAG